MWGLDSPTKGVLGSFPENMKIGGRKAYVGAADKISLEDETVVLGTAHPAKFSDVVMKETSIKPDLPENLKKVLNQKTMINLLYQNI